MPLPIVVLDPTKTNETYMTKLHTDWTAAKNRHANEIEAKKVNFSKDLGPMLDKRHGLYRSVKNFKAGDSILIARSNLNTLKSNGKDIKAAADSYIRKVSVLSDEAEKDLAKVLRLISRDAGQYDIDYANNKFNGSANYEEKKKADAKAKKEREKALKAKIKK
jgi:hypothetical protein